MAGFLAGLRRTSLMSRMEWGTGNDSDNDNDNYDDNNGDNDRTVPALELNWIDARNKKFQTKLEKLDNDLKNYKSNSIKESIRRGTDDLGDHFLDGGDLANALKCYR